jgi:hypothetical protein
MCRRPAGGVASQRAPPSLITGLVPRDQHAQVRVEPEDNLNLITPEAWRDNVNRLLTAGL